MNTQIQIRPDSEKRVLRYELLQPGTVFCHPAQLKNPQHNRCYYLKTRNGPLSLIHFCLAIDDIDEKEEVVVVDSELVVRNPPTQELIIQ